MFSKEIMTSTYSGPIVLRPFYLFFISQITFVVLPLLINYELFSGSAAYVTAMSVTILSLSVVMLSFVFAKIIRKSNSVVRKRVLNISRVHSLTKVYIFISPIFVLMHILLAGVLPLMEGLTGGDFLSVAAARENYNKNLNPLVQLLIAVNEQILPMLLLILLMIGWKMECSSKSKFFAKYILGYLVFVSMLGMAKMLPIVMLFLYFIVSVLIERKSLAIYLFGVLLFLFSLGLMGLMSRGADSDYNEVFLIIEDLIFRRVFILTSEVYYAYFDIFPSYSDFLYGKGIRFISFLSGDFDFQLANYVFGYMFPDGMESGWANTAFQGQLWADFSFLGIFFGSAFVGYLIAAIEIEVIERRSISGAYAVFLHSLSLIYLSYLSVSSLFGSLFILMAASFFVLRNYLFLTYKGVGS